jgi:hypothetical protein
MNILPRTETLRQITPRDARPISVENRFHKKAVILGRDTHMAGPTGQQVLDTIPLIVAKGMTAHGSAPGWMARHKSNFSPRRKPLNEDSP